MVSMIFSRKAHMLEQHISARAQRLMASMVFSRAGILPVTIARPCSTPYGINGIFTQSMEI